jgi:hypothetical protein
MNWHYAQGGQQYGPVPEAEFQQLITQGVIRDDTLVWHEGLPAWQPWSVLRATAAPAGLPAGLVSPPGTPGSENANSPSDAPPVAAEPARIRCAGCSQLFAPEDTLELGGVRVCAACKPAHLQRLQEGAISLGMGSPGAGSGASHGTASADEIANRDYEVDAIARIEEAWRFLFKEPGLLLLGGVLVFLIVFAMQAVPYLGALLGLILTGPPLGGLVVFYLRRHRGETVQLGDAFNGFGPRFVPLMLAHLVPSLLPILFYLPAGVFGGLTAVAFAQSQGNPGPAVWSLGIVAGLLAVVGMGVAIWLSISWIYTLSLVADKGMHFWAAMSLSKRVVSRHFWQHLWLFFLGSLIGALGMLACCVGILVSMPLFAAAVTLQYDRLFRDLAPTRS